MITLRCSTRGFPLFNCPCCFCALTFIYPSASSNYFQQSVIQNLIFSRLLFLLSTYVRYKGRFARDAFGKKGVNGTIIPYHNDILGH